MPKVTRRGFLAKTSVGAATVGALIAMPDFANGSEADAAPNFELTREEMAGPVVAHVRNLHTGEIAVMVGKREVILHDRRFVKRLVQAVR